MRLTVLFTDLRTLYYEVQSRAAAVPLDDLAARYWAVLSDSQQAGISRQIFLSDWYAHYKFFWQAQTDGSTNSCISDSGATRFR